MLTNTRVTITGLTFDVVTAGPDDGVPVLLLHGFPQSAYMWRHAQAALAAAGYRAIAFDQRGYSRGARPGAQADYATSLIVDDALAVMTALGHARFHLIGHDWGGQIAWLLAAHHAARVRSLAVLSRPHPAAFTRALKDDPVQAERSGHHRRFLEDAAITELRAQNLNPLFELMNAQGVPASDVKVFLDALRPAGAFEAAINWYRAGTLKAADTPSISVPTCYVWGDNDATVGRLAAELTAEYVRAPYRFVAVPGGGHFVVDQMPDAMNALLHKHLDCYR